MRNLYRRGCLPRGKAPARRDTLTARSMLPWTMRWGARSVGFAFEDRIGRMLASRSSRYCTSTLRAVCRRRVGKIVEFPPAAIFRFCRRVKISGCRGTTRCRARRTESIARRVDEEKRRHHHGCGQKAQATECRARVLGKTVFSL